MKAKEEKPLSKGKKREARRARDERHAYYSSLAVKFYLEGNDHSAIILKINEETGAAVTLNFIKKSISEAIDAFVDSKTEMIEKYLLLELQKIAKMEAEAWEAWERSKTPQKNKSITTVKALPGSDGKAASSRKQTKNDTKDRAGDPRFFNAIQWCVEQRKELLTPELIAYAAIQQAKNAQKLAPIGDNDSGKQTTVTRIYQFGTRITTTQQTIVNEYISTGTSE